MTATLIFGYKRKPTGSTNGSTPSYKKRKAYSLKMCGLIILQSAKLWDIPHTLSASGPIRKDHSSAAWWLAIRGFNASWVYGIPEEGRISPAPSSSSVLFICYTFNQLTNALGTPGATNKAKLFKDGALLANIFAMEEEGFSKQFSDKVKKSILDGLEGHHEHELESLKHWRAWGSWFSWGSPVGLGLFLLSIGAFLVLLHFAGLIG